MQSDPNAPDRRPLVYGLVGVLILLAAAFLFWPRGGGDTDVGPMVLTPDSVRGTSQDERATGESGAADALASVEQTANETDADLPDATTDVAASTADVTESVPDEPLPRGETRIVDSRPERKPESTTTRSTDRLTTAPATPEVGGKRAPSAPTTGGRYVLNLGSFETRANADRQVQDLAAKGMPAHVHVATREDGTAIYRVRVGYFESRSSAEDFGGWLQRQHSLDSWISAR